MNGLHLIADMYRCTCTPDLLCDQGRLEKLCVDACKKAGLTPLGTYFHQFLDENGNKAGVTGNVVLAESHLAIHTWPENCGVTLDVYVCNYSRDNSDRARQTFQAVTSALAPSEMASQEVIRGEIKAAVPVTC
jgi:S-adenosylmethionine decarboxylase proenzyme